MDSVNVIEKSEKNRENTDKYVLEVINISSTYDDLNVLDNINITIDKGEFVSVIGPSGCGKSTLFHIISGLLAADNGSILINGKDMTGEKNQVAYMYQKDLLLPWRKIFDNVALPYEIIGLNKKVIEEKVMPYFEVFGLNGFEEYYPDQLSGGMRQRAALMRTYMCEKDIMLLDEPFGRLDAITKLKMQQWLKVVAKKMNPSILFITHDIEEAIFLSDRIYVLSDRPAKVVEEVVVNLPKHDFLTCTTSLKFNELKSKIMAILDSN